MLSLFFKKGKINIKVKKVVTSGNRGGEMQLVRNTGDFQVQLNVTFLNLSCGYRGVYCYCVYTSYMF